MELKMGISTYILLIIWTTLIEGVLSGEYCYNVYHARTYYCEYGCCGDGWDKYCCTFSLGGLIAGCVIGALCIIAGIIFVIYFFKKQKGRQGRVIGPTTQTVAVVNTTGQPYGTSTNQTSNRTVVTTTYQGQPSGQIYPPSAYGPVYPPPYGQPQPPPGATPQTVTQSQYPPIGGPVQQGVYPPGPPPGASIYTNSHTK